MGRPGLEGRVEEAEGKRGGRPPAPPAVSRSPILYLMSLRWAAGHRPRHDMANAKCKMPNEE